MTTPRLPGLRREELSDVQRAVYDAIVGGPRGGPTRLGPGLVGEDGALTGPFNAMLVVPQLGDPLQSLGAAIRYATSLPPRARELAILVVAGARRSSYEWQAHERIARAEGLTAEDVAAVHDGEEPPGASEDERLVWRVARSLLHQRDLDDDLFTEAEGRLGRVAVAELIVLVGYYDLLALSMRVWRAPLPAGITDPFPE